MKLSKIREMFWPLLDPLNSSSSPTPIREENITLANEENLKTAYDWAVKYYENEDKRSSSVEAKSTIFIGSVGFLITILLTITKDLLTTSGFQGLVSVMAFSVIIIYLCRVAWFAIKALERNNYHTMGYNDFAIEDDNYKKRLITILLNYAKQNAEIVNRKVEYMTMAQEYFKRAIWAIAIYSVLLISFSVYKNKDCIALSYVYIVVLIIVLSILLFNSYKKNKPKVLETVNEIDSISTSFWSKIGNCFGFIINVFIGYIIIAIFVLKSMEKILYGNNDQLKLVGFFALIFIASLVAIGMYIAFRKTMSELLNYFKLWADFAAVLIPAVIMYKTYYIPGTNQAVYSDNLFVMLLLNEGMLGIPFVILLIRFIIAFDKLKKDETEKSLNPNNAKEGDGVV